MLESAAALVAEHADLERQLADPAVVSDPDAVRTINKRYAALAPTVAAYHAWVAATGDLAAPDPDAGTGAAVVSGRSRQEEHAVAEQIGNPVDNAPWSYFSAFFLA